MLRSTLAGFTGVRILVTHDPVEAMTLAERLVVMEDGRVTETGSASEIRSAPRTEYAAALVGLNLFRGRLQRIEPGVGILRTTPGDVVVAWPGTVEAPDEDVVGLLRPGDVSLYRARPEGSARNAVHGTVSSISLEGDRARIRIDGQPPLIADVTPGSVTRLGLAEGVAVWASFKAMEVSLVMP
jgi:molybdate transport system ATP-binding protein